jgi:hypothetical protein
MGQHQQHALALRHQLEGHFRAVRPGMAQQARRLAADIERPSISR